MRVFLPSVASTLRASSNYPAGADRDAFMPVAGRGTSLGRIPPPARPPNSE
jgi:hypothetical protein